MDDYPATRGAFDPGWKDYTLEPLQGGRAAVPLATCDRCGHETREYHALDGRAHRSANYTFLFQHGEQVVCDDCLGPAIWSHGKAAGYFEVNDAGAT